MAPGNGQGRGGIGRSAVATRNQMKVAVSVGLTVLVPPVSTAPMPSIETSVAFVVVQFRAALWPE